MYFIIHCEKRKYHKKKQKNKTSIVSSDSGKHYIGNANASS